MKLLYVAYLSQPYMVTQRLSDIVDTANWVTKQLASDIRQWEPLPRPLRVPLQVKQAPRQSFRKAMRSVNRNR